MSTVSMILMASSDTLKAMKVNPKLSNQHVAKANKKERKKYSWHTKSPKINHCDNTQSHRFLVQHQHCFNNNNIHTTRVYYIWEKFNRKTNFVWWMSKEHNFTKMSGTIFNLIFFHFLFQSFFIKDFDSIASW